MNRWAIASAAIVSTLVFAGFAAPVGGDTTAQPLPFGQTWADTNQITTNDDWNGVFGVIGYRGDGMAATPDVDPQSLTTDGSVTPVDVLANQTVPSTQTTGGVGEFELGDPVVALQASGTASAPHVVLSLDTTGASDVVISYALRDIDDSGDNAVQPVALQYRVGTDGPYTNLPDGFVADATTGPNDATQVTPVSVTLPADANDQSYVQVRIISTNATGSDEWVGVDDIAAAAAPPAEVAELPIALSGPAVMALALVGVWARRRRDVAQA